MLTLKVTSNTLSQRLVNGVLTDFRLIRAELADDEDNRVGVERFGAAILVKTTDPKAGLATDDTFPVDF